MTDERKHSHYFRPFPYEDIDIYRFLQVFDVACPVAQHIIKKAVATGKRGHKDLQRDWEDILDSAQRKLDMLDEDCQVDADNSLEWPSIEWFDASEQELGENALNAVFGGNKPPKIEGWTWYDAVPGVVPVVPGGAKVEVFCKQNASGEEEWFSDIAPISSWDWSCGNIVAYAIRNKPPEVDKPWYPNDIPGLEWKETTWEEPIFDNPSQEVYVLFRHERDNKGWDKEYGVVTFYDWDDDGSDFDIVAYAVKKD